MSELDYVEVHTQKARKWGELTDDERAFRLSQPLTEKCGRCGARWYGPFGEVREAYKAHAKAGCR